MYSNYVVWNNKVGKFIESVGWAGIFYTDNIDSAFQFPDLESARDASDLENDCVILEWI